MKRNTNLTKAFLVGGMIIASSIAYAGNGDNQVTSNSKIAVENLKVGINSDNAGLKKSSIYYAGFYRIAETVPALTEQIKKESDPKTRILIALVLYRIGDEKCISLVKDLAANDKDTEVRRMCTCIYNAYVNGNAEIALVNENE